MAFKKISPSQHDAFISGLRAGTYNLLLGAGASMDSSGRDGDLPSGGGLKDILCDLKEVNRNYSLQRVFSLLTPLEIKEQIEDRFSNCTPGPTAKLIRSFVWKRAFTWNVDDSLEQAYKSGDAKQDLAPIHYSDPYLEADDLSKLILVHLHGLVSMPEKGYVFSREQYIDQIKNLSHWMTVLTQFMQTEPLIISGTSMDEVDLDFYLSHRSTTSSREDRGPSIFVSKEDDAVTRKLCEQHNLLHFIGHSYDFFKYCSDAIPQRPTPLELVPSETLKLLPAGISKPAKLAFHSDFEIVPGSAPKSASISRFLYGHAPTWVDVASDIDVSRQLSPTLIAKIEQLLEKPDKPHVVLVSDGAGTGRTTILRRVAFEMAKRGKRTLNCTSLSRIDKSAASIIDLIDEPLLIIFDNFADQVTSVANLIAAIEKKDIVFLCAERSYRMQYIQSALSGIDFELYDDASLTKIEAERLIELYQKNGLVGATSALKKKTEFANKIYRDPIAVACCRILNDFRPLDRIVTDLTAEAPQDDVNRYLLCAIAQFCFKGGVRYEVLSSAYSDLNLNAQFEKTHPLSLTYSDKKREFAIPENTTIAERTLDHFAEKDVKRLLNVFIALANTIAPRVNRQTIMKRSPEARLSGRLFDYDDIVRKFLGSHASQFYKNTHAAWQWNSRYWEQLSLLNLGNYFNSTSEEDRETFLKSAVQHARHAVSIETHPFPLSTLGKVLMTQMLQKNTDMKSIFDEAFDRLSLAIEIESSWARSAVQPYVSLFNGIIRYVEAGGALTNKQLDLTRKSSDAAQRRFARDREIQDLIGRVRTATHV